MGIAGQGRMRGRTCRLLRTYMMGTAPGCLGSAVDDGTGDCGWPSVRHSLPGTVVARLGNGGWPGAQAAKAPWFVDIVRKRWHSRVRRALRRMLRRHAVRVEASFAPSWRGSSREAGIEVRLVSWSAHFSPPKCTLRSRLTYLSSPFVCISLLRSQVHI